MTRDEIKERVYSLIDEVSSPVQPAIVYYPVETVLDEAAELTLRLAPLRSIKTVTDFSDSTITEIQESCYGSVPLPEGFIKLACFKISSWESDTPMVIDKQHAAYKLQQNRYTRGCYNRPVVVLEPSKLIFYSAKPDTTLEIERAEAVCKIEAGEGFPEELIEVLCWIAASKALVIMREESEAAHAMTQAQEILTTL